MIPRISTQNTLRHMPSLAISTNEKAHIRDTSLIDEAYTQVTRIGDLSDLDTIYFFLRGAAFFVVFFAAFLTVFFTVFFAAFLATFFTAFLAGFFFVTIVLLNGDSE